MWELPESNATSFGEDEASSNFPASAASLSQEIGMDAQSSSTCVVPVAEVKTQPVHTSKAIVHAWMPWILLTVFVFVWGLPWMKTRLNGFSAPEFKVAGLHNVVLRVPPVHLGHHQRGIDAVPVFHSDVHQRIE